MTSSILAEDEQRPAKRVCLDTNSAQETEPNEIKKQAEAPNDQQPAIQEPLTQKHIFKNLRLRRIVRENHGSDIQQIALFFYRPEEQRLVPDGPANNPQLPQATAKSENKEDGMEIDIDDREDGEKTHGTGGLSTYERSFDKRGGVKREAEDNSNLLATVGQNQTSIYDNEHCGDHLDIMSHYTPPNDSKILTCCWIPAVQDALLALGGHEGAVRVLSLAWSKELHTLKGHTGKHPTNPQFILSVSKDCSMRVWDMRTAKCLCKYKADANVARFHPNGHQLLTGNNYGEIRLWDFPLEKFLQNSKTIDQDSLLVIENSESQVMMPAKKSPSAKIDCMRFAKGRVVSKNISGRIEYWELDTKKILHSFVVRNHGINESRFDVSYDDNYICVGNAHGSVYIYDLNTGSMIHELRHRRSVKGVRCCAFTRDCRSVIYAGEGAFIWRYDYVDDETLAEWENFNQ
ncbi:hypothetical protein H4219_002614 [Mycoemilia scoparia]|uniref:Uncharacterized protein n=1 Tax=Mycoemilia scoparia TaxID=417184 RepID=A0A9W8A3I0_9FUNG|nr:hypothetical protein H4219_002614 [Mycoemilia scoparia]